MNKLRQNQRDKIAAGLIFLLFSATIFVACKTDYLSKSSDSFSNFETFSHHAETLKKPNSETVRGDFVNKNSLDYADVKAAMSLQNGENFIEFGRGGEIENYKIEAVVGNRRIEEYVAREDGELKRLPIGYDLQNHSWINLNAAYFEPDGEDFFEHQKDWETSCASCHLAKKSPAENSPISTVAPASLTEHLDNQNNLSSDASLLACGQCHAKDLTDSMPNSNGQILPENIVRQTISAHQAARQDAKHFFADGSVRLTAHEYQGILRSVCYVKSKADGGEMGGEKINCLSCHTALDEDFSVATDQKLHTNQTCTQCHAQFADAASLTEHTKHLADSEANRCAACHQPEVVYGNLSFQKTHEISVPNPELTMTKQVPNACNQCHIDKSVNWAITQTKNLWSEHFRDAKISDDSQFDQPEGIRGLFAGDAFTRAWAANNLAKHSDLNRSKPFLLDALETENYPLVRFFLANALKIPGENVTANDFLLSPPNPNIDKIVRRLRRKRPINDIEITE